MTVVLREAWAGLLRNRTRSLLSMLGISWGIVSVVVLLAYGEGFKQALLRGFRGAFGDGVSINFPGQTSRQAGGERAGRRVVLRLSDVEGLSRTAAGEGLEPGVHAERHSGVGRPAGRATWHAASRRPTARCVRSAWLLAGSSMPRTCDCNAGSPFSAARWPARRSAGDPHWERPSASTAWRSWSSACRARRCSCRTTAGPTSKACSSRTRPPASCGTPSSSACSSIRPSIRRSPRAPSGR